MIITMQTLAYFRQSLFDIVGRLLSPLNKFNTQSSDDDEDDALEEVYADFDEKKGVVFFPPVYMQRYAAVSDCLMDARWSGKLEKIVDMGYHDTSFIKYIKELPGVQCILGVDVDSTSLCCSSEIFKCEEYVPKGPLKIMLFQGNAADPDFRLIGCDAVIAIEMIEHMLPHDLDRLVHNIFGFIKPWVAVITTPNGDFNGVFKSLEKNGLRRLDHFFEWSREQFSDWCSNIVSRYPKYTVTCKGVGPGPEETHHLGCCSQLALFVNTDYNKQQDLNIKNLALVSEVPSGIRDDCLRDRKVAFYNKDNKNSFEKNDWNPEKPLKLTNSASETLTESSDKTLQCNLEHEISSRYLMFEDEPDNGSVIIPRRRRESTVYLMEDVSSRLNCTTLQVKRFSKTSQSLMNKNMADTHTKEVVNEIRHLSKMLGFDRKCLAETDDDKHIWCNINWGVDAPYWNQYYKVVKEFNHPFEPQSDECRMLDLISEEINRVVDIQCEMTTAESYKIKIPIKSVMEVVTHITQDYEKVKELLEWNGYEIENEWVIYCRPYVTDKDSRHEDWLEDEAASDWGTIDVHSTPSETSIIKHDFHGRYLRRAIDKKVRMLRSVLRADEELAAELDRVISQLIRLALHRSNRSTPPSRWIQYKLLDLLVLTEKAILKRQNSRQKSIALDAEHVNTDCNRTIKNVPLEDKYANWAEARTQAWVEKESKEFNLDKLTLDCGVKIAEIGPKPETVSPKQPGGNETIIENENNLSNENIYDDDKTSIESEDETIITPNQQFFTKPSIQNENNLNDVEMSKITLLKKNCCIQYDKYIEGYKTFRTLAQEPKIPKSLISLCLPKCRDKINTEAFPNLEIWDTVENISASKQSLLISIITDGKEEIIALRKTIGTDPEDKIPLSENVEYSISHDEVTTAIENLKSETKIINSVTMFMFDINTPSTSKGAHYSGMNVQCGPDVVLPILYPTPVNSVNNNISIFTGIRIEDSVNKILGLNENRNLNVECNLSDSRQSSEVFTNEICSDCVVDIKAMYRNADISHHEKDRCLNIQPEPQLHLMSLEDKYDFCDSSQSTELYTREICDGFVVDVKAIYRNADIMDHDINRSLTIQLELPVPPTSMVDEYNFCDSSGSTECYIRDKCAGFVFDVKANYRNADITDHDIDRCLNNQPDPPVPVKTFKTALHSNNLNNSQKMVNEKNNKKSLLSSRPNSAALKKITNNNENRGNHIRDDDINIHKDIKNIDHPGDCERQSSNRQSYTPHVEKGLFKETDLKIKEANNKIQPQRHFERTRKIEGLGLTFKEKNVNISTPLAKSKVILKKTLSSQKLKNVKKSMILKQPIKMADIDEIIREPNKLKVSNKTYIPMYLKRKQGTSKKKSNDSIKEAIVISKHTSVIAKGSHKSKNIKLDPKIKSPMTNVKNKSKYSDDLNSENLLFDNSKDNTLTSIINIHDNLDKLKDISMDADKDMVKMRTEPSELVSYDVFLNELEQTPRETMLHNITIRSSSPLSQTSSSCSTSVSIKTVKKKSSSGNSKIAHKIIGNAKKACSSSDQENKENLLGSSNKSNKFNLRTSQIYKKGKLTKKASIHTVKNFFSNRKTNILLAKTGNVSTSNTNKKNDSAKIASVSNKKSCDTCENEIIDITLCERIALNDSQVQAEICTTVEKQRIEVVTSTESIKEMCNNDLKLSENNSLVETLPIKASLPSACSQCTYINQVDSYEVTDLLDTDNYCEDYSSKTSITNFNEKTSVYEDADNATDSSVNASLLKESNLSITDRTDMETATDLMSFVSVFSDTISEYLMAEHDSDAASITQYPPPIVHEVEGLFENIDRLLISQEHPAFSGFSMNTPPPPTSGDQPRLDPVNLVDSETGSIAMAGNVRLSTSEELMASGRFADSCNSCLIVESEASMVPRWLYDMLNSHQLGEENVDAQDFLNPPSDPPLDVNGNALENNVAAAAGAGDGCFILSDVSHDSSGQGSSLSSTNTSDGTSSARASQPILSDSSALVTQYEMIEQSDCSSVIIVPVEEPSTAPELHNNRVNEVTADQGNIVASSRGVRFGQSVVSDADESSFEDEPYIEI